MNFKYESNVNEDATEIIIVICAIISAVFSFLIVLTVLMFRKTMFKKTFTILIYYMSMSELVASIGSALGFPNNLYVQILQTFLVLFFYRAAALFTVMITYQIHHLVLYDKLGPSIYQTHCMIWLASFCFAIPGVMCQLNAVPNDYKISDDLLSGPSWCQSDEHRVITRAELIYFYISYPFFFILAIGLMCRYIYGIYLRLYHQNPLPTEVMNALNSLKYYPAILIFCWAPINIYILLAIWAKFKISIPLCYIFYGFTTQSGTLTVATYFSQDQEAKQRWLHFFGFNFKVSEIMIDFDRRSSAIDINGEGRATNPMVEGTSDYSDESVFRTTEQGLRESSIEAMSTGTLSSIQQLSVDSYEGSSLYKRSLSYMLQHDERLNIDFRSSTSYPQSQSATIEDNCTTGDIELRITAGDIN